ncbi:unnamed protein product [Absidia cylindrospora]
MMNIADMLNPSAATEMLSPPLSPKQIYSSVPLSSSASSSSHPESVHGKPRSRFSDLEDAIICDGVAKGLTWGQISNQLPHRKRATCFNRYRTLQGIRKSRKRSLSSTLESRYSSSSSSSSNVTVLHSPVTPTAITPVLSPSCSSAWTPSTPPSDLFLSSYHVYSSNDDPLIRRLSISSSTTKDQPSSILPPIYYPQHQHQYHHYNKQPSSRSTATQLPYLV